MWVPALHKIGLYAMTAPAGTIDNNPLCGLITDYEE
jgi:hypothetical protein